MYRRHKRYVTRDGQTMWAQNTFTLMPREDDRPARLVAVVEDITEHLRLAEAERAREAAELSNRAKSEFLSRMSHELRTAERHARLRAVARPRPAPHPG